MRKAGVLMHISTLPGKYGCGTFGKEAYAMADFLADAGFTIWQVLPFNVPHKDASPYSSASTFAENPLFIDPDVLRDKGLLTAEEVGALENEIGGLSGDLYELSLHREKYLKLASDRARSTGLRECVEKYLEDNPRIREACQFLALGSEQDIFYYGFIQYEFSEQWGALHGYLRRLGIEVIGDIPIYADLNSSEVYYNPECFLLDESGVPEYVSGVPGDSFNKDGQKWGHPLYCKDELKKENYSLLFDRMKFAASVYDVIRIDHFQAIAAYYAIPRDGVPADGHWEEGVGEPFVKRLASEIGRDRFVVEDFNCFPGGSYALATKYGFPDMNTLQFTLDKGKSPDKYREMTVAYTGTHDNDTFLGYLESLDKKSLTRVKKILGAKKDDTPKKLLALGIESLLASPAERVVIPVQDLLSEGSESRMNVPGISGGGNWHYRLTEERFEILLADKERWKELIKKYER